MNNSKYYPDEIDYYSPAAERRRKRAIDSLNEKPGISPGLKRILLYTVLAVAGSKVLYEVVKLLIR